MAVSFLPIFMMLFAGGGVGNDLLDFVPTKAYFKAAGIEMNIEALAKVLDAPAVEEAAARAGDSAKRQLALRALGELKDAAAVPIIEKHIASRDPLVADYAKAARAAIKGEKHERPAPRRELLRQDLACLPSGVGAIGRLSATSATSVGGAVDFVEMMNDFAGPDAPDAEEMEAQIVAQMGQVISGLGNIRLSAVTFGVASDVGDNQGFVVALARGLYDAKAVEALLGDRIGGVRRKAGGLVYHEVESDHVYVAPVSNELFVFAAGASREEIPLEEVGRKVLAGGGDFAIGKDLAMLLDRADTTGPMWALVKVSEAYKQVPFLAPFDTLVMGGKEFAGGKTKMTVSGKGADAEAIAGVVEELNNGLTQAREEIAKEAADFPGAGIVVDMLKSVSITAEGGSATMAAEMPQGGALSILPMMFFSRSATIPGPDDAVPVPLEAQPDPAPAVPEAVPE